MSREGGTLDLELVVDAGDDIEERDELTGRLLRELREADTADDVRRPAGTASPDGAKGDLAAVGTLIVTVVQTAPAVIAIVDAVRSWLGRRPPDRAGSVTLRVGDAEIEVTGNATPEQQRLIEAWLQRFVAPS